MSTQCDFCMSPDWKYTHYCDPFTSPVGWMFEDSAYEDDGQWAACQECHDLIVADNQRLLLLRSMRVHFLAAGDLTPTNMLYAGRMQQGFFDHYHGVWEEGDSGVVGPMGSEGVTRSVVPIGEWNSSSGAWYLPVEHGRVEP